jgi:hypothetical protein
MKMRIAAQELMKKKQIKNQQPLNMGLFKVETTR